MSNTISSLLSYLNSTTTSNQVSQNPILDSDNSSDDSDNLISSLSSDSVKLSPKALSALSSLQNSNTNTFSSALDTLVSNGTITSAQENSIKSAFISAKNSSLSYSGTSKNNSLFPLDALVSNGTITKDQENSIKEAFISAKKSSYTEKLQKQAQSILQNPILAKNPELLLNSDLYKKNNDNNDNDYSYIPDTSYLNKL